MWSTPRRGRCYHDTFDVVEFVYQTTDHTALAAATADERRLYVERIRPCPSRNGVDAPADVAPGGTQYANLADKWSTLDATGKC